MTKKTYTVTSERWEHGWELHVDGVGITQCNSLADAERMALDYIATELGGEPQDYAVTLKHDLGGIEAKIARARQRMAAAQREVDEAADEWRDVAQELRGEGISVRDSAVILDVSPGRVSQLITARKQHERV